MEGPQPQLQSVRDSLVEDVVVPLVVVASSEVSFRSEIRGSRVFRQRSRQRPFRSQTTPRRPVRTVRRRMKMIILDSEGVSDVVSPAVTILYLHIITFLIQVNVATGPAAALTRILKVGKLI